MASHRPASFKHRLFLLRELVKRDIQARYAGSLLGIVWSFLQPLWQLALFTFVFSTVMKISPGVGERTDSFAIFLFCGLLPWMAVQEGVLRASTAITDNAVLVKKLAFPASILVVGVVITALVHEAIALGLFVVILALLGELSPLALTLLLLVVPLQVLLTLGLGFLLAPVHVLFRDTAQVLPLVLNAWFYLTPIVYPLSLVPEQYRGWLYLNPMTVLVGLYRQALLGPVELPGVGALALAGLGAGLLAVGLWLFRRLEPGFVDEI